MQMTEILSPMSMWDVSSITVNICCQASVLTVTQCPTFCMTDNVFPKPYTQSGLRISKTQCQVLIIGVKYKKIKWTQQTLKCQYIGDIRQKIKCSKECVQSLLLGYTGKKLLIFKLPLSLHIHTVKRKKKKVK